MWHTVCNNWNPNKTFGGKQYANLWRTTSGGLAPKLGFVTAVSFAQALYALPLAVATSAAAARAPRGRRAVGWAGVAAAAAGLLGEHLVNDYDGTQFQFCKILAGWFSNKLDRRRVFFCF